MLRIVTELSKYSNIIMLFLFKTQNIGLILGLESRCIVLTVIEVWRAALHAVLTPRSGSSWERSKETNLIVFVLNNK